MLSCLALVLFIRFNVVSVLNPDPGNLISIFEIPVQKLFRKTRNILEQNFLD